MTDDDRALLVEAELDGRIYLFYGLEYVRHDNTWYPCRDAHEKVLVLRGELAKFRAILHGYASTTSTSGEVA